MRGTSHVAATLAMVLTAAAGPTAFWQSKPESSLTVIIAEVPGDTHTPVTITGPDGYRVDITKTAVLRQLEAGRYTVTAETVSNPLGDMTPQLREKVVDLARNDHQGVAFTYQFEAPALSPVGAPDAYAIQTGTPTNPVRWNPCSTITWGPVLPLPAAEEQRLTLAFAKASIASGIPFRRVAPGESAQVSVNLTMAPGDRVSGEGEMYFSDSGTGRTIADRGQISGVIGTETSDELREALYLHEIGHVLGITHVPQDDQVMHEVVDESDAKGFAIGDTNGLRLVGAAAGCLDTPLGAKEVRGTLNGSTLTVTWFQPASQPPVVKTTLHLTNRTALGRASGEPAWDKRFVGAGAGPREASATVPANVCDPGISVTIAATNANGTTETPVVLSGCPK
ncbi:MAG: Matrixin family metalloprotease [Actinomycetota bacterium]|nr:Matrixin family metalloprotease [Actinomycetota bacterium]